MKKIYWLVPVGAVGIWLANRAGVLTRDTMCETSPHASDPALRTRVYAVSPDAVRAALLTAVRLETTYGRSWRVGAEREDGAFALRVEIPVLMITHDLTATISPHERGSRLDVHSRSRGGISDLGENRRHVLQLLQALDAALPAASEAELPDRRQSPRATVADKAVADEAVADEAVTSEAADE